MQDLQDIDESAVAIIGMAGRFPRSPNVDALWQNLLDGRECLREFTDEELLASGTPAAHLRLPTFVRRDGFLEGQELFDAAFFDIPPREAELLDPQHRLGLECAWEAFEDAGYDPERAGGPVGVFAGVGISRYFIEVVLPRFLADPREDVLTLQALMDRDYFPTRISYKLNLKGPSLAINTACSTSLVCVHAACQSLLSGECRVALAGGAHVNLPRGLGYVSHEGSYGSPDGHCRAFDAKGRGTVSGNGVGFVVLKRLGDALRDRDRVVAVIRGSAVNNDGSAKIGYTAPSVEGQLRVITEAIAVAGVEASTIRYVETHGTGTQLGDPIEATALARALSPSAAQARSCAIGSIKPNVGHLGIAAGVTSLIKAARVVETGLIPPSINFDEPNPNIDFAAGPLFVNTRLRRFDDDARPRRAGVSSFGIGGTNAHVILEEPPRAPAPPASPTSDRAFHVFPVSARTERSLAETAERVERHLAHREGLDLRDAAFTLQRGRRAFEHRRCFVARAGRPLEVLARAGGRASAKRVVFLFSGGGSQHLGMGRGLYEGEPLFRAVFEEGARIARAEASVDLRALLYGDGDAGAREVLLTRPASFLPAVFAVEIALARLWMSWGVMPSALTGHSLGEYAAACVAGVLDFPDAMRLVCHRGRLFDGLAKGAMLSLALPEAEVQRLLPEGLSIAAINGPASCVVAGDAAAVDALAVELLGRGVEHRRLNIDAGGHSALVEPILDTFEAIAAKLPLRPPRLPYVSNVTGAWVTPEQATDPRFWSRHLRATVRFADSLGALLEQDDTVLLEIGPGTHLTSLAKARVDASRRQLAVSSMRHPRDERHDGAALAEAAGRLWVSGASLDWSAYHPGEARRRVALPGYAFDRKRYWMSELEARPGEARPSRKLSMDRWFHVPAWRRAPLPASEGLRPRGVLLLGRGGDLGARLAAELGARGVSVITAEEGPGFARASAERFTIDPRSPADHGALLGALVAEGRVPDRVVHLLTLGREDADAFAHESFLHLAGALAALPAAPRVQILAVTDRLEDVRSGERTDPRRSLLAGPAQVIPLELPHLGFRRVDFGEERSAAQVVMLAQEICADATEPVVAYRGRSRWAKGYLPVDLPPPEEGARLLKRRGTYLLTGGLGGMGLTFAAHLAGLEARLALVTSGEMPARSAYAGALADEAVGEATKARIRAVLALEERGAEVLVVRADVAVERELAAAVAATRARFGRIDGVIHAAGRNDHALIQAASPEVTEKVLAPKVQGTEHLFRLLADDAPDFFVLCGSLSAVTSAFGAVDYVSANAFLDAFAQRWAAEGARVVALDWDVWEEVGMATRGGHEAAARPDAEPFILPAEGVTVLLRALAAGHPQVAVSTRDFAAIERKNQEIARVAEPPTEEPLPHRYERADLSTPYAAPEPGAERALADLWEEVLKIAPIGVEDNFFELGGDSLLAVRILSRMRELGFTLSVKELFLSPTIRAVARASSHVEPEARAAPAKGVGSARAAEALGLDPARIEDAYALAPMQRFMLREGRRRAAHRSYLNQSILDLEGELDLARLAAALDETLEVHPALRTAFLDDDGPAPIQAVIRGARVPLVELDWSALSAGEREARTAQLLAEDRDRGFDPHAAPLMRVHLVRLDRGAARLRAVFSFHQAMMDGWSSQLVFQDLFAGLLRVPVAARVAALGGARFRDYLAWLGRQDLERASAHLRASLAGAPPGRLLSSLERADAAAGAACGTLTATLDAESTARLEAAARDARVTVNTAVQAAWARVLGQISGAPEVVFGVTMAGRPEELPHVGSIVGQYTTVLPLRVRVAGEVTATWLEDLQARNLAMRDHAVLPPDELTRTLGGGDGPPRIESNLIFENVPLADPNAAGALGLRFAVKSGAWIEGWHFPLRVFVFPERELGIRFSYDRSRYDDERVARALARFVEELTAMGAS